MRKDKVETIPTHLKLLGRSHVDDRTDRLDINNLRNSTRQGEERSACSNLSEHVA